MGNNSSGVDFVIKLDKEFYFSSEEVKGHLFINAKKRYPCLRIVLEIEGIELCEFRTTDNYEAKGSKKLIHTSYVLAQFGHNQYLEGQCDFPFSFRFFEYLPGSFKQQKQYKAQVTYFVKAIIVSKDKKAEILQKKMEMIIRQPQRSGERMLNGQTFALCRNCFCLDRGVSRIYCYFQKNYYLPGQQCIIICEVDNTKCLLEINRVKCQLIKEVRLTDFNGTQRSFTELLNTVYFPGIASQRSYFGENAERQTLKLAYKDSPRAITPSTHGHYVRCQYYVLVQPLFGGCFTKVADGQVKVQLTILQPANHYDPIEQPQDWRPDIRQKSTIFLEAGSNNEQLSSANSIY